MVSETKTWHEKGETLKYLEAGKNMCWVLFCFSFKESKVSPSLQLRDWNWKCTCHKSCCYLLQPSGVLWRKLSPVSEVQSSLNRYFSWTKHPHELILVTLRQKAYKKLSGRFLKRTSVCAVTISSSPLGSCSSLKNTKQWIILFSFQII